MSKSSSKFKFVGKSLKLYRYLDVEMAELVGQQWNDPDPDRAPTLRAVISHCNRITSVIMTSIVSEEDIDARAKILKMYIQIATVSVSFSFRFFGASTTAQIFAPVYNAQKIVLVEKSLILLLMKPILKFRRNVENITITRIYLPSVQLYLSLQCEGSQKRGENWTIKPRSNGQRWNFDEDSTKFL